MSSPKIPQPHDGLIRYTFGQPENAASLFQAHLLPELVETLDWKALRLESGSYVSEELRQTESDLLYSVPALDEGEDDLLLYLLFEHQSTSDDALRLRLLSYKVEIWRRHKVERDGQTVLPLVLPIVFAQVAGGWSSSVQFADMLKWPRGLRTALEMYQPKFEHILIDLSRLENDDLRGNTPARLAQSLLRAAMRKRLLEWIEWAEPLLRSPASSTEFLGVLFLYAANAEADLNLKRLLVEVKSRKIPKAEHAVMSIAEEVRAEGRIEGRVEGLLKGDLIGQVRLLQQLLHQPVSSRDDLDQLEEEQLNALIAELRGRI